MLGRTVSVLIILGVTLFFEGTSVKRIPSFAGPYRIIVNHVSNISDEFNSLGQFYVKIFASHPKQKQPQYLWGLSHIGIELNDDMRIGERPLENKTWEFVFPAFPVMPYGRYRFSMAFVNKAREDVGVIVADVEAVPKI